jgi:hypothetical protein
MKSKKIIQSKRTDVKGAVKFWTDVLQALDEGWKVNLEGDRRDLPRWFRFPAVVLFKEDSNAETTEGAEETQEEVPEEVKALLAKLEPINSKIDLLGFAIDHSIEIPETKKQPTAIKKYLQEVILLNLPKPSEEPTPEQSPPSE